MGRYAPNPKFLDTLAVSPTMRRTVEQATKAVKRNVSQSAPRATGYYARRIVSGVVPTDDGWVGRVGSEDPFWHLVEFGSVNNPAYAPLRRGLEKTLRRTRRIGRSGT